MVDLGKSLDLVKIRTDLCLGRLYISEYLSYGLRATHWFPIRREIVVISNMLRFSLDD